MDELGERGNALAQNDGSIPDRKRRRRNRLLDELVMPELSGEHTCDCLVFAKSCRQAGIASADETLDGRWRKDPDSAKSIWTEVIPNPFRSAGSEEAGRIRRAIWLLPSFVDARGKDSPRPAAKYLLLAQATEARTGRQGRGEFVKPVIEKWKPPLDAVSHRHAVSLRAEEIRREQRRHFEICRLIERRPSEKPYRERGTKFTKHVDPRQALFELGRIKVLDAS